MRLLLLIAAALLSFGYVQAKAVFAHFMVSNTRTFSVRDWENDISLARDSHIDGFALNIAYGEETNKYSLANAFTAANNLGADFKLLFSFDYAGNGSWPKEDVIALISQYGPNRAYYKRGSQPFVSTFEGPDSAHEWFGIKEQTNCFFVPSWSSLGAKNAVNTGVVDGLFSWAAWPEGPEDMYATVDASYRDFLKGMPYMMPVAPWFFTNLPGYRKNWIWRGDDLWFDRWQQVLYVQPEYVEIITWNDWGESHYIGPLRESEFHALVTGKAPYNYVADMPHDGWRLFLPYLIDMYKQGIASITREGLVSWYRLQPGSACTTGGTTGNTASHLQKLFSPLEVAQDKIFYSALLASNAEVTVTIGGASQKGTWSTKPGSGVGVYHGSVPFGGKTGAVTVTISRSGSIIAEVVGKPITTSCTQNIQNWNPWVGSASAPNTIPPASPDKPVSEQVCVRGTGPANYAGLCSFTCHYGYCPLGACTCTAMGTQVTLPNATDTNGCPADGLDATYLGLCSFSCNRGYCPSSCVVKPKDFKCTALDPVGPPVPVCISGTGEGNYSGLCSFACNFGFCPPQICTCAEAGTKTATPPPETGTGGRPISGDDYGLCSYTCNHGYCPSAACLEGDTSDGVRHISPASATVIPFPATTVAPTATFTVGGAVVTNIQDQPYSGDQNRPKGPGANQCRKCDLARLITSTCCGIGGGVANPIEIQPLTQLPRALILPAGFIPNQPITDVNGLYHQAGEPLPGEVILREGIIFLFPFRIPPGLTLSDTFTRGDREESDNTMYIIDTFWEGPHTISCSYPCTLVFPPSKTASTWTPAPFVTTISGRSTTVTPSVQTTQQVRISTTTIQSSNRPTQTIGPTPAPTPLCHKLPIIDIPVRMCPPGITPFPPKIPPVTIIPVPPGGKPGPTNTPNVPSPDQQEAENEEEEEEEQEENEEESCPYSPIGYEDDSLFLDDYPLNPKYHTTHLGTKTTIGAGTGTPTTATLTVTVGTTVGPPPPPSPTPPPDPKPPTPDPDTEVATCFKRPNREVFGGTVQEALDKFCEYADGEVISKNNLLQVKQPGDFLSGVVVGVLAKNNCEFVLEEKECKRILNKVVGCHPGGSLLRIGGQVTSNCAVWTLDPVEDLHGSCIPIPLFETICLLLDLFAP